MKKVLTLAGLSAFLLIGAAYPDTPKLAYGAAVMAGTADVTGPTYRPCRRDRRDDRCIQLYERGVRAHYAMWLREHGMGGPEVDVAAAPRRDRHRRHDARHARRQHGDGYAMNEMRCMEPGAHPMRMRDDERGQAAPMDHRRHEEHRAPRNGYDGEVRGM